MIEAVGHEFWGTYFQTIDRVLAPGGKVAIQAITMPHDRMLATRGTHTWINKYIFPGGFLPSTEVIDQVTRDETDLRLTGRLSMGSHYAETLRRWDETFLARARRRAGPGLRRPLHADLALLPRLLARRLRQRLHRRPAAHVRAGRPDDRHRHPDAGDDGDRAAPRRGRAPVPRRRPAGPPAGLGRLGRRAGGRAAGRAPLPRRAAPAAVAPGRARGRAGLRHRRARRPRAGRLGPRLRPHPRLRGGRRARPVRPPTLAARPRRRAAHRRRARRARPAARAARVAGADHAAGCTRRAATGRRSATTTTSPTSSTR